MKKLIVCDFDGTLYKKENKREFENVLKTIEKSGENGILFAVATGRPLFLIKEFLKSVYKDIFVISCDGALITKDDKTLYSCPIDSKTVCTAAENADYGFAACTKLLAYIKSAGKSVEKQLFEQLEAHVLPFEDFSSEDEIYKMFFIENPRKKQKNTEIIKNFPFVLKSTYMKNGIFEFSSPKADKANAAEFLMQMCGVSRENVFVFGNGDNDLSLFKRFENSYADIASPPQIKHSATHIFDSIQTEIEKIISYR